MKSLIVLSILIGAAMALPRAEVVPNSAKNMYRLRHLQAGDNAEELSGQFEGDIVLTEEQLSALRSRNGIIMPARRWQRGIVPYVIEGDFSEEQRAYIRRGLDTLELASCLKFIPRTTQVDWVYVTSSSSGCFSNVGRTGGSQQLNLQSNASSPIEVGCLRKATIMHEFIHAIGFYHMQSTFDRDDYVTVAFDNIEEGKEHNFNKYNRTQVTEYGLTYDYDSVMHYGPTGFSINGKPTLVPKDMQEYAKIGQRVGLSRKDIEKINRMYNCPL